MKECKGCHIEKPEDKFYKNPSCFDGLNPYCIQCFTKKSIKHIDKKKCVQCNKIYQPKGKGQRYCSERCKKIYKKDKRRCRNCGDSFYSGIDGAKQKYCSDKCAKTFRGYAIGDRNCKECGRVFTPNEDGAGYKYCSKECAEYKPVPKTRSSCKQCGKDIEGRPNKKYCSKRCKSRAKYERNSKHTITCIGCGDEAVVTQEDGKYCSVECFYKHTIYDHFKKVYEYDVECATCGKGFTAISNSAKYCSDKCNPNSWDKTRIYFKTCRGCHETFVATRGNIKTCSDKCTAKYRRVYVKFISVKEHYKSQEENPDTCINCGDEFIRKYGFKSKACSDQCREQHKNRMKRKQKYKRKMLKRGASVSHSIEPMKVFNRDKHRCQMCGCKTPKRLRGTIKDNAPEIDHIIPLSKGGNHSYNNVQTLCRNCNIQKSDQYVGQQPLQFGRRGGVVSTTG